jgi:predicted TIM-barrel fold metal-dependent hydrolase
MAINGKFVIDGVCHAFDMTDENLTEPKYAGLMRESIFGFQHLTMPPRYRLTRAELFEPQSAELVEATMFVESDTDVVGYHPIPAWGIFKDLSPIRVAVELRERYPGRVYIYGAVSPLEGPKAMEDLQRQVEEIGVRAIKLYPVDIIDGEIRELDMSDEKVAYPLYEACLRLGVRVVAIHKALPIGLAATKPFRPDDVDHAAADFPDLAFEIVHGGYTFLDETAFQLARFPNVYVNLEATSALLIHHPRKFARIFGELMVWSGHEKVMWGTGTPGAGHPQPILEAFEAFRMPDDLVEGEGYAEVTDDMKADILANNFARVHGLDIQELADAISHDDLAARKEQWSGEPWVPIRATANRKVPV